MDKTARLTNPVLQYGLLLLICAAGLITLLSHTVFHSGHNHAAISAATAITCSHPGVTHVVDIRNGRVSPVTTEAKLCDKLKIVNHDTMIREMAFGAHEDHESYDGVAERILGRNQSLTIILNQTGLFHYHDHVHDEVSGYFNVSKQ